MSKKRKTNITKTFTQGSTLNKVVGLVVLIILTIATCYISAIHRADDFVNPESQLVTGFYLVPVLLLAGLYGYFISYLVFLFAFICALFFNMSGAYTMVIYMVMIFCFAILGQFNVFSSIKKTILLCTLTLLAITANGYFCFTAITDMDYRVVKFIENSMFTYKELTAVYGAGLVLFLLYKYAPDSVKLCFPLGVIYTKKFKEDIELQKKLRITKVNLKISISIIVVELIMGIFAGIFLMVLFPDIKQIISNQRNEEYSITSVEEFNEDLDKIDYKIDNTVISFDVKMLLLLLCIGVPIAAIANFFTQNDIAGPIGEMSDFMNTYAITSDDKKIEFGKKVDDISVATNDEIKVLYDSIHAIVYEIEAYIMRVTEEQRLMADLEIARQANDAKSSFLSNMSHEIRTPINAIIGMNEMILRECDDKQILVYANNAKSAGNSLLTLVNDILDFSKIEAGKMEIIVDQYQLGSTINDLINIISVRANEKNLDLEVNVDENIPSILIGDEIRIKQCVTNLLSNAVKYTEKGKVTMDVSYEKIDEVSIELIISVKDTGMGIKQEDLDKLFSPFERIEEMRNRTIEGTGLGMSIVKKLLSLMDTSLQVKSIYGQGSEFSFRVKQDVVSWEPIGDFKEKYKEYIESIDQYYQRFQAPDARILVVDDTEMNLTVIKGLLKQNLIQIDTAISGLEALEKVKEVKYDIIFLDHRMPGMDGLETFDVMKVLDGNINLGVPVIALTANAVFGAKEEYVRHGFTDYLAKPINGLELEKMIEYYLPPEKITSVSIFNGKLNYTTDFRIIVPENSFVSRVYGINVEEAVGNCGSVETLENVIKDFYISIDFKADAIEEALKEGDIRNYTVFVHALKSSAKLIGALELSDMAAQLEDYGNAGYEAMLKAKTPELLEAYRSYKVALKAADDSDKEKPLIEEKDLANALRDIKELIEAYDFDTADSIIGMLQEYEMPENFKEKFLHIKELIVAVDRDKLMELL